ncbi:MAG: lipocalin family protein, partial [Candidatus Fonsibacter sp.]
MYKVNLYFKNIIMTAFVVFFLSACNSDTIPNGLKAVEDFNKDRYLGKWFEIARFDFRFEKDLNNTTAEYSLNPNGSIKVVNKGFNYKTNKWQKVSGK